MIGLYTLNVDINFIVVVGAIIFTVIIIYPGKFPESADVKNVYSV